MKMDLWRERCLIKVFEWETQWNRLTFLNSYRQGVPEQGTCCEAPDAPVELLSDRQSDTVVGLGSSQIWKCMDVKQGAAENKKSRQAPVKLPWINKGKIFPLTSPSLDLAWDRWSTNNLKMRSQVERSSLGPVQQNCLRLEKCHFLV